MRDTCLISCVLRACRGCVIVVVTDPRSGLSRTSTVVCDDCTNDLGRGEAMLMCRSPVIGKRLPVAGFLFCVRNLFVWCIVALVGRWRAR